MFRHLLSRWRHRHDERDAARGARPNVVLPLDMFDTAVTDRDVKVGRTLTRIYTSGQKLAWSGDEVLGELLERHGGVKAGVKETEALQALLAVILWGELAAWKISARLAVDLEPLGAKLAATSQAHDEARHFHVMHDYLAQLGEVPRALPEAASKVLTDTLTAPSLAARLLGMQLMVEPMALTIFQVLREHNVEPVLTELLRYIERDEARHVALGVLHLPRLVRGLSPREAVTLWRWQLRAIWHEFDLMHEILPHLQVLGIDPQHVLKLGQQKQVLAIRTMTEELGWDLPIHTLMIRAVNARTEWDFPADGNRSRRHRGEQALRAIFRDIETQGVSLAAG